MSNVSDRMGRFTTAFPRLRHRGPIGQLWLGRKSMRRREMNLGSTAALAAGRALAQVDKKPPLVAYLSDAVESDLVASAAVNALRRGLRDLGFVDGHDLSLDLHFVPLSGDWMQGVAEELVRAGARAIVTNGNLATRTVLGVTRVVPIIVAPCPDPLGEGFVHSLARPGGNVTGMSFQGDDLWEKQASLLREAVPGLQRVAILSDVGLAGNAARLGRAVERLSLVNFEVMPLEVVWSQEFRSVMTDAVARGAQGLLLLDDPNLIGLNRNIIAFLAGILDLPTMGAHRGYVEEGILMSYGANLDAITYRAAWYVKRILEGVPPGDLPIERPTKFELVLNLKTATSLGLTIPPAIMLRAEEVIE